MTSSLCYNEIVIIEQHLISLSFNNDEVLQEQAKSMRTKFEKYWDGLLNMNPFVIIGSIFDPRNKMQFASIFFDKLYGKNNMESMHLRSSIKTLMKNLYEEYASRLSSFSQGGSRSDMGNSEQVSDVVFDLSDEDGYDRESLYSELDHETAKEEASSELDIYLIEKRVPRLKNALGMDYDVLSWWRRNSAKFPILSELARDVLAIQVSSAASESAFSTSGRWMRNTMAAEKIANLAQMQAELEFHDSLASPSLDQPQADV
ncbi:unnamed protein product [Arabidopsis arenosa]|uniref:Uncharacterized protein n=1 Tax=Arabidopsis arenosa TaxID=38785 RepID=A0A8S2A1A7_ARAAE|nr:unnamed protein product [Arabidopsis arenosa]